ncbi:MAG: UDP-N-acetylmuramate:L-alanyl-gamma-D-glutamyl-meso-diaminopimelate ligase [Bdellovibrionota bacterium]
MNLKPGAHIHLMGICGTAMGSLAGLLQVQGFKVTGSDTSPYPPMSTQLEKLGIPIMIGYKPENLKPKPDFVIVGNVVSANNPEAQEVNRLGIPFTSLPKAMGEFIIQDRHCVCISGTHGKTTTTSVAAWMFDQLGLNPGFLIGGVPKNFDLSFRIPTGNYFIIEGDEYDTAYFDKVPKFIHYKPRSVILTSVEFDHADIYKDLDDVKSAFKRLLKLVPDDGVFIYWAEDANIKDILKSHQPKQIRSYGLNEGDYQAKNSREENGFTVFDVQFKGENLGTFRSGLSGSYNVLNCLSLITLAHFHGFNLEKVKRALESFEGVKRRQEIRGEPGGRLLIEDFAHHPTAVKKTVEGIIKRYPGRRVFSIFEPRSATSRRKIFQREYVEAFLTSSEIILAEPFDQSKITETDRFSTQELKADLEAKGKRAHCFQKAAEIVDFLKSESKPGDILLVMSNGGFDGIYEKILKGL